MAHSSETADPLAKHCHAEPLGLELLDELVGLHVGGGHLYVVVVSAVLCFVG